MYKLGGMSPMSFTICTLKKSAFSIIDGNNFYVSCERVFNPRLNNKPVVVLSSNDGCAIARSNEIKALNIAMGAPLHTFSHLIKPHEITVLSSNFELYGDISARMMNILRTFTPDVEIYSIDEAFLDLSHLALTEYDSLAQRIFETIRQWIGIPVTLGIAQTKTLAKVANRVAKKKKISHLVLQTETDINHALSLTHVSDIWGIGRAMTPKLKRQGIYTGLDLAKMDPRQARQQFTVVGERLVRELQGLSCLDLQEEEPDRKSIQVTRSFGSPLTEYDDIAEAISLHATTLGEKLRKRKLTTPFISIFCRTSKFGQSEKYFGTQAIGFNSPTNDTKTLINGALKALKGCFRSGYQYRAAGIQAFHLNSINAAEQLTLNETINKNDISRLKVQSNSQNSRLNHEIDTLNKQFGRNTVFWASTGINPKHIARHNNRTNRYTTRWNELVYVLCK